MKARIAQVTVLMAVIILIVTLTPASADSHYPLVEEFDDPGLFTQTTSGVYIDNGMVHWNISRRPRGFQQYVYRDIPPFSGDVRLTVRGQVNSWTNNCSVNAGIGGGFQEINGLVRQSGIAVRLGFYGGGCGTSGPLIRGSGVTLSAFEQNCNFYGNWLWINRAVPYTAELMIQDGTATLDVPGVGTDTGTPNYTGEYNTLFVGNTGGGDYPSCSGTIDSITVEPLDTTANIAGEIDDGRGNPLQEVHVELLSNGNVVDSTSTTESGQYTFPNQLTSLQAGDYVVRIPLQHKNPANDDLTLQVHHGEPRFLVLDPLVAIAETDPFTLTAGETKQLDIDFGADLSPVDSEIPQNRLDDLAAIYVHSMEALLYGRNILSVNHDLDLPIKIFSFYDTGSVGTHFSSGDIYIDNTDSFVTDVDRPMNREWHEMFHELMDDVMGIPQRPDGDQNHGGFANSSTTDSWIEGWAEFWPTQLKDELGQPNPEQYTWNGGTANLELNYQAFEPNFGDFEEFAVASLLWDLTDGTASVDSDAVNVDVSTLWPVISSTGLTDMKDVYDQLVDNNIGASDSDSDGITDLDELFVAHGFFVDANDNTQYDSGEEIGRAADQARPERRNTPNVPGAAGLIRLINQQGEQLETGTIQVRIELDGELAYYNYEYNVALASLSDQKLGLYPPPSSYPATIYIKGISPAGEESDTLAIDNGLYWDLVQSAAGEYVFEHEFELGQSGKTTTLVRADIKPGSDPNSINCTNENGVIPVAILSTEDFDALSVNHTTVTFESARETHTNRRTGEPRRHEEDVDGDGDMDLVFHFRYSDTSLICESVVATITGETFDGGWIEGPDSPTMISPGK